MESNVTQKNEVAFDLDITLTAEEFAEHERKVYRNAQKQVVLKGYRKGHVPLPLIKKLHGQSLEQDIFDAAVQASFASFAREKEVKPMGQPLVSHIHRTDTGGLHFTISYEVFPTIELKDYRGLPARRIVHQVTDDEVEAELQTVCERFGKMSESEQVVDDLAGVTVDLQKIVDGQPEIGSVTRDVNVYLRNPSVNPGLKAALINRKVGDSFRIDLETGDEGAMNTYDVIVTKIMTVAPAPLDDTLARTALGNDAATLDDLRDAIRSGIAAEYERRYSSMFRDELVHALIERHPFTVPQALINEVLAHYLEEFRGGKDKELPKDFDMEAFIKEATPRADSLARWALLRDLIIDAEGLKADEADYEDLALIESQRTDIEYDRILKYMMKNNRYADRITAEKAVQFLEDYAIVQEVDDRTIPALRSEGASAPLIEDVPPETVDEEIRAI